MRLGDEVEAPVRQLPAQPTRLVGRDADLAVIRALLLGDDVRLLTLTGVAGIGKTRLAVAVAHAAAGAFADGACFVDLVPLTDPERVMATIAHAVGAHGAAAAPLEQHLHGRQLLLVLDNCEHLLPSAGHIGRLIAAVPGLKILATSREPLRLRWEQRFPVPPLALPDLRADAAAHIAAAPAVMLFVDRARAVRPGFALTPAHARAVAEICVRLDGLPLAVELAAAQTGILAPADILTLVERQLPLPPWRAPDAPARHQTLRAAIDWSYRLLPPDEQSLLGRLSVFAGDWTLAAAVAVAVATGDDVPAARADAGDDPGSTDPLPGVLKGVGSLVDRSLVQIVGASGATRYRLLEIVREFARVKLEASGQAEATRRRHAAYFLCLAERGLDEPDQPAWHARLMRERENVRAALRWATHQADGAADRAVEGTVDALGPAWARWAEAAGADDALPALPTPRHGTATAPLVPEWAGQRPPLSDRERAVLRLIAGGLANKQIARELAISERTVKVHVSSVLNKLGAENRAQAAVLATRRGLL